MMVFKVVCKSIWILSCSLQPGSLDFFACSLTLYFLLKCLSCCFVLLALPPRFKQPFTTSCFLCFQDEFYHEIMGFLSAAEEHGKNISTIISQQGETVDPKVHNVAYEAKIFKQMFLKLRD